MHKAVSGENPLEAPEVIREFVEQFQEKIMDAVNGCCTNDTAHVIACVLEQIAKHVRSCTNDERAKVMEMLYKLCFRTESVHMTIPKIMETD